MARILVSGGNGFIGGHVVERLSREHEVVSFDIADVGREHPGVSYVKGDLTQPDDLLRLGTDLGGIVHLGAVSRVGEGNRDPVGCMKINVMGTMNILELAKNLTSRPWVILGSTIEGVTNIYGISKYAAEMCAERYGKDFAMRVLALRFASAYGSARDNKDKVIPKLIFKALEGQEIVLDNAGKAFDFVYIDDLVAGIYSAVRYIETARDGLFEAVELCSGKAVSLRKLSEMIVRETGSNSAVRMVADVPEDAHVCEPEKALKLLGFSAQVNIEEGIRRTVKALRALNGQAVEGARSGGWGQV